jgi:hypothetical protein
MPTVLDIARYADVSAEKVLRVLNGEPVSVDVSERVRAAIESLGMPPWPNGASDDSVEVVADPRSSERGTEVSPAGQRHEARFPEDVGGLVYEAVRVEVRPVSRHIEEMQALVERLCVMLERVGGAVERERKERLEDVALVTDLVVSGWRNVDRRMGRIERMLERQEAASNKNVAPGGGPTSRHVRIEKSG